MSGKTLFVSDLDGTLLNSNCKVSHSSAAILNRLIAQHDLMFTVATARTPATVVPLLNQVDIKIPMVVMTGAAMWNNSSLSYTSTRVIPPQVLNAILEICLNEGISPFIYTRQDAILNVYHSANLSSAENEFVAQRCNSPFKRFHLNNDTPSGEPLLIFATCPYDKLEAAHKRITSCVQCEAVCYKDIYNTNYGYLEIFAAATTKASAITALAASLGADKIVAFGDNRNDIPMLQAADIAVAMGNAFPEVKQVAHVVIDDNNSDSVARWINDNWNKI